jgi:adenine-specific DNA-methyltransferase
MARKQVTAETKIESIRHKDKRTNIPTEELRDFIAGDEQAPKTMFYNRNRSLDLPQKNTGAGNLFMVFGEPDVEVKKKGNELTVEIKGVDVYDPTTGQIRNASTDDIACWFIDTDYNGESFFVRHAYFTGADEPYEKLKRALKAEIDEAAWASLYGTTSRPFPKPASKKIAVKVINHYGDEVLKVIAV